LEQLSAADESLASLRSFAFASACICYERLERIDKAQAAREQLTAERMDLLRRGESQIYDLLQASLRRLIE